MVDFASASEQRRKLLEELKNKDFSVVRLADEFDSSLGAQISQLEKGKCDLKKQLIQGHTQRLLLECLINPPNPHTWPSSHKAVAEEALAESSERLKRVKENIEEIKNELLAQSEIAQKNFDPLLSKKVALEKKLLELVDKCGALNALQKRQEDAVALSEEVTSAAQVQQLIKLKTEQLERVRQQKQWCQASNLGLQADLERVSQERRQAQSRVSNTRAELQRVQDLQHSQVLAAEQQKHRLQQLMSDLGQLSGVRLGEVGEDSLALHFVSDTPSQHHDMEARVTLKFGATDTLGFPVLTKVQTSSSSLQTEDLLADPLLRADLPGLVTRLKARWQAHVPLLSEIEQLHRRFAVDWIQEESCLRAMVGQGGGVVCTLAVPPTYPLNRSIALVSIQGADIGELDQLRPQRGTSLHDWVSFLEETFGRP